MSQPKISASDAMEETHLSSFVLVLIAMCMALSALLGGRERWSAAAYETALMVPGAPETWGAVLAVIVVLTTFGYTTANSGRLGRKLLVGGFWGMFLWFGFFGASFVWEFFTSDNVSFAGPALNIGLALLYLMRAMVYSGGRSD